jgi:hypothetical protein
MSTIGTKLTNTIIVAMSATDPKWTLPGRTQTPLIVKKIAASYKRMMSGEPKLPRIPHSA